ncbi:MAG: OmpA family protein [bacterium]
MTDARMMAEGLLADLRKRLKDTSLLISDTIEAIVNEGFALIRDTRNKIVGSVNNLIETVRSFAQGTLDKIKDASADMFRTSKEALELGFTKVNEGIELAVEDLGNDLNQQINNTQDKMKREAEKQARELKVMGEEAFAQAEQDFVNNGYEEDTSKIPEIRQKGEEAVGKIEQQMKQSAEKLKADFQAQVDAYVPKFQLQGKALVGVAQASTLKVIKLAATLGPAIAMDLVQKTQQFVGEFKTIGDTINDLINGKGKAYIDTTKSRIETVVETVKTSALEFSERAKNDVLTLVSTLKERFENLAMSVKSDVEGLVSSVVGLVEDTAKKTEQRFVQLYNDARDGITGTIQETKDAINDFVHEAEQIMQEAIDAAKEIGLKILNELKDQAIEELKRRLEAFLDGLIKRYRLKLQAALDHLKGKGDRYDQVVITITTEQQKLEEQIHALEVRVEEIRFELKSAIFERDKAFTGIEHTMEQDDDLTNVVPLYFELAAEDTPKVWGDPRNAHMKDDTHKKRPRTVPPHNLYPAWAAREEGSSEVTSLDDLNFAFDKYKLDDPDNAEALAKLETYYPQIKAILGILQDGEKVALHGHTDRHGTEEYNQTLSELRARAVRNWILARLQKEDADNSTTLFNQFKDRITAEGFGETDHKNPDETPEADAQNRRVTIHLPENEAVLEGWEADKIWIRDFKGYETWKVTVSELTVLLAKLEAELKGLREKIVTDIQISIETLETESRDSTSCLRQLYEQVLATGMDELKKLGQKLADEAKAIAEEKDLTPEEGEARLKALRDELTVGLKAHAETMKKDLVEDHKVKLEEASAAFDEARATIEAHLESLKEHLKPAADPKMLLERARNVIIPQLEEYISKLLNDLLDCYAERVRESAPMLADLLDLIGDFLEGKPTVHRAWDIFQREYLPKLAKKAEDRRRRQRQARRQARRHQEDDPDAKQKLEEQVSGELLDNAEKKVSEARGKISEEHRQHHEERRQRLRRWSPQHRRPGRHRAGSLRQDERRQGRAGRGVQGRDGAGRPGRLQVQRGRRQRPEGHGGVEQEGR